MMQVTEGYRRALDSYDVGAAVTNEARLRGRIAAACFGVGIAGMIGAAVLRDIAPNWLKGLGLLSSMAGFATAGIVQRNDEILQKLASQFDKASREKLAAELNSRHNYAQFRQRVEAAQFKLHLISLLPVEQQLAWIQREGLADMLPQMTASQNTVTVQTSPIDVSLPAGISSTDDLPRADVDTSWLTPEFARSSKVVFAERGAGKSFYLRWELATCQKHYPDMILLMVDPHLRANQMESEGAAWLDMEPEQERQVIVHSAENAKRKLAAAYQEVKNRLEGTRPTDKLFKIVIDEADSEMVFTGRDGAAGELLDLLKLVTNEARKANVEITLVAHSVKKGTTGFDMSHISQINWLMLGGILSSPDIVWPKDLAAGEWAIARDQLQATLDDSQGRAAVLRERGAGKSGLRLVVVPRFNFSRKKGDLIEDLRSILGESATIGEIATAIKQITGQQPDDKAIAYAIEKLGIEIKGN